MSLRSPGVVWFGETLPDEVLTAAQQAVAACDFFISAGTSGVVYPAAGLIEQALDAGARVLEVNSGTTPFSDRVTWFVRGNSGEVLPRLVEDAFGT